MRQRLYDAFAADSFAGDDQDRIVASNRAEDFSGCMGIDIRSDPHRIAGTGLYHGQVTGEFDPGMLDRFPLRFDPYGFFRKTIDIISFPIVYFGHLQLFDVARKSRLRNREAAGVQLPEQFFLIADSFCSDDAADSVQSFLSCTHCVYIYANRLQI